MTLGRLELRVDKTWMPLAEPFFSRATWWDAAVFYVGPFRFVWYTYAG